MTDIDTVAEAILGTMEKHRPRRIRRAELDSIQYEECQEGCKYELGGSYEHLSKLSAQAAIDALQITQEAVTAPAFEPTGEMDDRMVLPTPKHRVVWVPKGRWISPWVRVEEP